MNRLGATLLGGLIGAGAALLLAPRSGPETRRRIRDQAGNWRMDAQGRFSEGRMRATEIIRSTQERANDLIERGQRELPEALTRSRRAVDDAADRAQRRVEETQTWAESSRDVNREEIP